ncbi:MAG: ABC transporter ATP-binding protein [Candidatus Nanopelagicales bacterium]|nr:ABC transporter ATP-binding protein [Candidatus Nanopelagicales bacterium]
MGERRQRNVEDLHLSNLTKKFGDVAAVDDLTLTIPAGSFFALLGASGCGKTTTLRMVAGLEDPTSGRIAIGEKDITALRAFQRPVNTVFQSYALFPHLDIFENVAFGLRRRGIKKVEPTVNAMLELVELAPMARRKPTQLSGGQQQRVAVARALINEPDVLLLDEPLGALDLKLRRQMQIELKRIQTEVGTTFVHVTHDQEEAMTMADTIAVMNAGRIEQLGDPASIYELPHTVFVANFLGQSNLFAGTRVATNPGMLEVLANGVKFLVPTARNSAPGDEVIVGIRPEKMTVLDIPDREKVPSGNNALEGRVVDVSYAGVSTQYLITLAWGQNITVFEQNVVVGDRSSVGDQVLVHWSPEHTFGLAGGETLLATTAQAIAAGV